jgi:anti-sigma factor RsiW
MIMATPIDDDTLQRFYDGELSPAERRSVEARVAGDPAAQRRLRELAQLSTLLRDAADAMSRDLDSEALFASIASRIDAQPAPGFGARLRVVTSEWMAHRRATLVPAMAATAVAAATLIAVLRPADPGVQIAVQEQQLAQKPQSAPAGAVKGSRIEEVDFGSSTGTIFEIDDQGVGVAVVWISDDEEAP